MGARRVLSPPPLRAAQKQNPEDQCGLSNTKNKKTHKVLHHKPHNNQPNTEKIHEGQ